MTTTPTDAEATVTGIPLIDPPARAMTLRDGRALTWQEYGEPDGLPVLYLHGGGGTSLEGGLFHREAVAAGLRLIATNRPGAGGSSLRPGRPIAAYADDVAELLDHLGADRFACFGESNGGLTAMALAATMSDRIVGAAPINPTVPWFDPVARRVTSASAAWGYRIITRMPRLVAAIDAKVAARTGEQQPRPRPGADGLDPRDLVVPPAGAEPDIVDLHLRVMAERAGRDALVAELEWARRDWGFDHYAIPAPLDFHCGVHDAQAPFALVLADRNPDARFHHFSFGHSGFSHPDARRRIVATVAGYFTSDSTPEEAR
jgi:pimeloyl-ACP methyl ester carboxylesterase